VGGGEGTGGPRLKQTPLVQRRSFPWLHQTEFLGHLVFCAINLLLALLL
jgi:hypothetical protein